MTKTTLMAACIAATLLPATSAIAQSSIGMKGASFSFAGVALDNSDTSYEGDVMLDIAVTEYHGLQGDLSFYDTDSGMVGRIGGHAYLEPGEGRKYGLFGTYGDLDGASYSYIQAGIEGMWSLGERTTLEARAGMGMAEGDLDYIFGGAAIHYAATGNLTVSAGVDVAEFDEAAFSAIGYNTFVAVEYDMPNMPVVAFGEVRQDMLEGSSGAPAETTAVLGIKIRFGNSGGINPNTRPFRTSDPMAQLVRRGLF